MNNVKESNQEEANPGTTRGEVHKVKAFDALPPSIARIIKKESKRFLRTLKQEELQDIISCFGNYHFKAKNKGE